MKGNKKYFWLKLKRDFFKRHDIQIIEAMQNGKDYILFYLKLLCESVDHEGKLRFSEQIPYNEQMLSTITNTNVDIVRAAIKVFTELEMMEILDDGTLFMLETQKMIGSAEQDEHTRENTRLRVQAYRERKKQAQIEEKRYSNVTCNVEIEKEIDIDIEKEKKKEPKHAHGEHKNVKLTDEEHNRLIKDYGQEATEKAIQFLDNYMVEKVYKSKSHNMALRRWVFDAVKEREQKQAKMQPKNSFNSFSNQNKYTASEMSELEKQLVENMGD